MDFDEDDFIFIESEATVESLEPEPVTPSKAGRSRAEPVFAKRTSLDDGEPSTARPKLKRSFRTSPEVPGPSDPALARTGKRRKRGPDPDSEEERWLDALEEGKLEQVDDELKKMRNPLLMTARQRAMLEKRSGDDVRDFPAEPLVALPSGYRDKSAMTEEMVERHRKKTERRREQAKKQRDEEKKKTVSRLLNKSDWKAGRGGGRLRSSAAPSVPAVTYLQTVAGAELRLPAGLPPPVTAQPPREPPAPRLCGVPGCRNPRRYSCASSGVALCSLQCFRTNRDARRAGATTA